MKRLLVISNNVLSYNNNNGKTLLSFIAGLSEIEIKQLYFSGETPTVESYEYFQISDKDIIKGLLNHKKRGRVRVTETQERAIDDFSVRKKIGRTTTTLCLRDLLWMNHWKSRQLLAWLDAFSPDAIFFIAGDALFAYNIARFIANRFHARLTVYMTDDYIMPRENETVLFHLRRCAIRKKLSQILSLASHFYTVSEPMREEYHKLLGVDSSIAVNMTDDLLDRTIQKTEEYLVLVYAGSFYYHRADVLGEVAKAISRYNSKKGRIHAKLLLYSNYEPDEELKQIMIQQDGSEYRGSLNKQQLNKRLNTADILVFVESFDPAQIEKTKYSLSTKVPEYLSVGKPILAIGPGNIGSISYLSDVSLCVQDPNNIDKAVAEILGDEKKRCDLGASARKKYVRKHNKALLQKMFVSNVMGDEGEA